MNRKRSNDKTATVLALGLVMIMGPVRAYDTICAGGYYLNSLACQPCPPGHYCPQGKKLTYDSCPVGTYSGWAASECTTCPAGY
jgi:hypothetical protein